MADSGRTGFPDNKDLPESNAIGHAHPPRLRRWCFSKCSFHSMTSCYSCCETQIVIALLQRPGEVNYTY